MSVFGELFLLHISKGTLSGTTVNRCCVSVSHPNATVDYVVSYVLTVLRNATSRLPGLCCPLLITPVVSMQPLLLHIHVYLSILRYIRSSSFLPVFLGSCLLEPNVSYF
ncbi:unnamed protein product [Protopolystoma xenopodis]|uniref:Uncharacterized protein n=1 Tax=Protopolystoma xenopodis TaxID=117903 RepID=A0A3S5A5X1_9PLAT|nr:unnamed protein product [Protopolystoma xenopodis]